MTQLDSKNIPNAERLIFAMDVPSPEHALQLADALGDAVHFYKLGLQLFMTEGYFDLARKLQDAGKKIFVDLKFFDVPATVGRAVKQLERLGAAFATVHGNDSILQAAADNKGAVKILAVTALTSLDRGDLDDLGFQCDVEDLVYSRAKRALRLGCDGVVSSGLEAQRLRSGLGEKLLIISPGIRPVENREADDQKRVVTVPQAFEYGADYIVVGRPIRDAKDPRAAALKIQSQIQSACA